MTEAQAYQFIEQCDQHFLQAYTRQDFVHHVDGNLSILAAPVGETFVCMGIHALYNHKYVEIVSESSLYIYGALPIGVIQFHRDILACVQRCLGDEELYCMGGGYLDSSATTVDVYGESTQFGPGNHRAAKAAFDSLLSLKNN